MDHIQDALLSEIHPAFPCFKVTVKIDRSYCREIIQPAGPNSRQMKEVASIDIVVYDLEGTKMVARLESDEAKDRFTWMVVPGVVYEVCNPYVEVGGEGVHEDYHLLFHSRTHLRDSSLVFPPFPYTIKSVFELKAKTKMADDFFDVVGFFRHCLPISTMKLDRFWEQEMRVVLNSWCQETGWGPNEVVCIFRGTFLEAVEKLLNASTSNNAPPFVHVRYVMSCPPYRSGVPVVRSYSNATTIDIDPPIPQVQILKQLMLGN